MATSPKGRPYSCRHSRSKKTPACTAPRRRLTLQTPSTCQPMSSSPARPGPGSTRPFRWSRKTARMWTPPAVQAGIWTTRVMRSGTVVCRPLKCGMHAPRAHMVFVDRIQIASAVCLTALRRRAGFFRPRLSDLLPLCCLSSYRTTGVIRASRPQERVREAQCSNSIQTLPLSGSYSATLAPGAR